MHSLHIIYASTSGHTEYVVQRVVTVLEAAGITPTVQKAEEADADDLTKADVLLLASSTWNTGGREGQLNPHMFTLLHKRAKDVDLAGKPIIIIGLGDERYTFTVRAAEKLIEYIESHNGQVTGEPLRIVNEPYHQNDVVDAWAKEIIGICKV